MTVLETVWQFLEQLNSYCIDQQFHSEAYTQEKSELRYKKN